MRRAIVFGFVLVCITALSFFTVSPVERRIVNPDGTITLSAPSKPTQVEVINFPTIQAVSGTVSVGNLPLDAEGNVRVSGLAIAAAPQIHFVGFTSPAPLSPPRWLEGSRRCATEIPGARLCTVEEFYRSIPVPPPFPIQMQGTGWARMFGRHPGTNEIAYPDVPSLACLRSDGELEANACLSISGLTETPFACCGF